MTTRVERCSRITYLALSGLVCIGVLHQFTPRTLAQGKAPQGIDPVIPRIQRTELLNGVRVLAIERAGEIAVINLLVKAGSSVDPRNKAGLANLKAVAEK
jgi:hypothetical protein